MVARRGTNARPAKVGKLGRALMVVLAFARVAGRGHVGFVSLDHGDLVLAAQPPPEVDQLAPLGAEREVAARLAGLGLVDRGFANRAPHGMRQRFTCRTTWTTSWAR